MEQRKFSVHPDIIYHLIVAQAGSLAKAALECVMNSIDAGARRIDIDITRTKIHIRDDGQGFRSRQEIENWFEVFGFPHEQGDRVYGQFGIGRGQLWSFCSTVWRTGTFRMNVDIKRKGLDYELIEGLEPACGVTIDGTFYTPLKTSEVAAFEHEVAELARYSQVPLYLNGKCVSFVPSTEKWDHETEDAWIRVTDSSTLAVYNLGVLVRRYSSYHFGCGGVVVTKPGVRLALNMARNDILVAECQVWKCIRRFLQAKSDERVRTKKTRMTEAELENFAKRAVAEEVSLEEIKELKLVTDITGRGHTLDALLRSIAWSKLPLTAAEDGSRLGERAHRARLAFVLSKRTLARFGVESVAELKKVLERLCESSKPWLNFREMRIHETVAEAAPSLREGYEALTVASLSKAERAAERALSAMAESVSRGLLARGLIQESTASRALRLGASDTALAWTDGRNEIVVERRTCELMRQGVGGFVALANILVHEYCHDESDIGSHQHDLEFYQKYHDATCGESGVLDQAVMKGMHRWWAALKSLGLKAPAQLRKHLDIIEELEASAEAA